MHRIPQIRGSLGIPVQRLFKPFSLRLRSTPTKGTHLYTRVHNSTYMQYMSDRVAISMFLIIFLPEFGVPLELVTHFLFLYLICISMSYIQFVVWWPVSVGGLDFEYACSAHFNICHA